MTVGARGPHDLVRVVRMCGARSTLAFHCTLAAFINCAIMSSTLGILMFSNISGHPPPVPTAGTQESLPPQCGCGVQAPLSNFN